ncbi:PilC/PilY family type IV pilus protein [Acidithiobacillus sp. HP-11]|uniref:PilC/PilY family type IV pilus protein n=1 Tax=Acidithiobacillus sp. HP-11 TaxID=2697656 RepID=UPI0018793C81|nr:PilC/PilY family type IV pilus protein [Acidithiobacillus sp. HP-11]MBE7565940.1 pilus assembly protein PilY [Acidithiobacillus sp. HP-11]
MNNIKGCNKQQKLLITLALAGSLWYLAPTAQAITVTDNFTGQSANLPWLALGDACLTAGSGSGTIPSCSTTIGNLTGSNQPNTYQSAITAPTGSGALILTPNINKQEGAIIDPNPFPSNAGVTVTFNTFTFGGTGADGIGFYLLNGDDASAVQNKNFSIGAIGGSLGYSCSQNSSNESQPNGIANGYLGLGIDEFGNFVNPNDNTNSGPGFIPNSIAMRGYGNVNEASIANALGGTSVSNYDVMGTCQSGGNIQTGCSYQYVCTQNYFGRCYNYSSELVCQNNTNKYLPDYKYIPNSEVTLPSNQPIANTNATSASTATPISYKITITPAGLLSFSYSYNNGAYQQVLNNQSISSSNGPMPSSFLFGFGASTGGDNDFHEITCFQAAPANQSSSSASVNVQETGELQTSSQVFLAYYSPDNWWGRLTAQQINVNSSSGVVTVNPEVNWDAACVLTGGVCASTYNVGTTQDPTGYTQPTSSTLAQYYKYDETLPALTWNGSSGISFNWSALNSYERGWLNGAYATSGNGQHLLRYLKGDTNTNYEATSYNPADSSPQFRIRTEILGDIINSSPTWIGGPDEGLPATFSNAINPSAASTLNTAIGTINTYPAFANTESDRLNVVYVGANDGMLHGFAAGSYSSSGFVSTNNTGQEVLAYVPYAVLQSFNSELNTANDYAYPDYGHNFYVNATPASGDVFYGGNWQTLLVGGMGTGGRGLYMLNVTNPSLSNAEPADVLADYTFANQGLVPSNATTPTPPGWDGVNVNTGTNSYAATMGDLSGKPIIRLMNNGDFAIISGNGTNSDDGEAGIFIFLVKPSASGFSIYKTIFLGTGTGNSTTPDGIDYVSSADLNGDHFVDYLYAGDTDGNVWRFNVTGSSSASWGVSTFGKNVPTPLFTTATGQPITTRILVDTNIAPNGSPQVMLQFGTGNTIPLTNTSPATYATTPQAIYDIWDGGMSTWNGLSGATQYNAWPSGTALPLTPGDLQTNIITNTGIASNDNQAVNVSSNSVCWAGSGSCTGNNAQYGSMLDLPSVTSSGTTLYQQVTYNPSLVEGAAVFDTTIPPYNNAQTCTNDLQTGFTYAFNPLTGGAIANGFFRSSGTNSAAITLGGIPVSGLQLNATGSPTVVSANGQSVMVQQTVSGTPVATEVFPVGGMGSQINWIELR